MPRFLLVFLLPFGCSSNSSTAARLADGSWHLTCKTALGGCVQKAEQICKEQSYEILRGRNERRRYGHELGESQVVADRSEIVVRCAGDAALPPSSPVQGGAAPAERAPNVCTKGSTQACVGAGACAGGQACLADGSGFGPCDCGPTPAPAATP